MNASAFENISGSRLSEVRQATTNDPVMIIYMYMTLILEGWPDGKSDIPVNMTPYFDMPPGWYNIQMRSYTYSQIKTRNEIL